MTRARNIAGFSTITTTPSPVNVGPIGVLTATRIDGEFNLVDLDTRDITAQGIGVTNLQVSGITTGLNVSGIITAQNGINFNGTSTGLNVSGIGTIATLNVTGNATVGGVLTYEDVTRVDSIGIVTARGLSIFGNTTGLQVASGISTFQAVTGTTGTFSGNATCNDLNLAGDIIHTGDTNTRIKFAANDTVTIETDGAERLRLNSTGQILVGTTSDGGSYDGVTPKFVSEANSAYHAYSFVVNSTNAGHSGILQFVRSRGTSDGANTIVQDGDRLGSIYGIGADGTNRDTGAAAIDFKVDGTPGENDMPGRIEFRTTAGGAASPSERMRIDSDGRVLIGDTTTGNAFSGGDSLVIGNTSSNTRSGITLVSANNQDGGIYFSDGTSSGNANVQGQIVYDHNGTGLKIYTTAGERMRITSGGNVNIGGNYTQTTYTAQVTGTFNATSDVLVNGKSAATAGKAIAMAMVFG